LEIFAVGTATIQGLNLQLYEDPLKQALTAFGAGSRLGVANTTAANPFADNG
jgi:hypothetical protein